MQSKILMMVLALLLAVGVSNSFAYGEKKVETAPEAAPVAATVEQVAAETAPAAMPTMDEAQMKKMMEMTSPNEHHAMLNPMTGSWKTINKWWMSKDAQPEVTDGTSQISWIMNGHFLKQEFKGTSMGQPFEGMGIVGYDNVKGEYTSIWIDSMLTGIMSATSQYDAAAKTLTEQGSMACPMTGEKDKKFRSVTTFIDEDHFTYEMYSTGMDGKGEEFKTMEITYEKQK